MIAEELALLLSKGVTEAELGRAKQGYLQQQQVSRTSDGTLASILGESLFVDRTMAYYSDLEKKINALTPEQVLAALKKRIDPKRLVIVDAGDLKAAAKETAAKDAAAKDSAAPSKK